MLGLLYHRRLRNVKRKTVPPPRRSSTQILPPCASTMVRQIERPSPMPLRLVVTKGWNRLRATSGARPAPVSADAHLDQLARPGGAGDLQLALVRCLRS